MQERGNQFYILTSYPFYVDFSANNIHAGSNFSTQTVSSIDVVVHLNSTKSTLSTIEQTELLSAKGEALGMENYDIILNNQYIEGFRMDSEVLIGIILFAIFIIFTGIVSIYSIFDISIVNSMEMYAKLMSLGTTSKQLKVFLLTQGNILAIRGISIGIILSLIIIYMISGFRWILYNLPILLLSAILTYITIRLALRRPAKLLEGISPIDAMRHSSTKSECVHVPLKVISPRTLAKNNLRAHRRNTRLSVLSLGVSGTLIIALAILIGSINLPAMLMQSYPVNEDF